MKRRQGFTIIELLVAMALIIFIMAILSEAFVTATQTFSTLKAMGDMAERLRSSAGVIRADLAADHFEARKRLSQSDFWLNGPPDQGFFRIYHGSAATAAPAGTYYCVLEGVDLDNVSSYRTTNHMLHFTVKLRGNQRSNFLSASVPALPLPALGDPFRRYQDSPLTYTSQWAEVAYFLQVSPLDSANGTPLFSLFRRQRLAVMDPDLTPGSATLGQKVTIPAPATAANDYPEVSYSGTTFNSPVDLTVPPRRFGMDPTNLAGVFANGTGYPPEGTAQGENAQLVAADLLLTDVVSFDVRFMLPPQQLPPGVNPDFIDLFNPAISTTYNGNNTVYPAAAASTGPRIFDTWSKLTDNTVNYSGWSTAGTATSIPITPLNIQAIQIIIRIWDSKTSQTRQMTIIQDL